MRVTKRDALGLSLSLTGRYCKFRPKLKAILLSPMLEIAAETRPPKAVELVVRYTVMSAFPTLQITPSKDIDDQCVTDPAWLYGARPLP
jgi:hypothetical protein